jgi:Fe-S cluster assembly protein SufD
VETYVGVPGEIYLTNAVTTVVLDEGATVTHGKLQDESEAGFHLASLEVRQGRESRFDTHSIALGAALARHEVTVQLGGTGAEAHVHGLLAPRGEQHHANPTTVDHASPGCASRQSSVGVIDGRGQGVSDGRVVVRPGADGTDAHQITRNLLLTDAAQVATRPRLEIHAEDVRCTHGATVGHLDEDAVFYLRSRGIPHQAARSVLVQAFTAEAIGRLPVPALRSRVEHAVARRLGLGG